MTRPTIRRLALLAIVACLALAVALPAAGCPVCYGEAEGDIISGTKWSVAFLGGLVYLLLGGVGGLVLVQRKRLQRMNDLSADPHHGLHLVDTQSPATAPPETRTDDPDPERL